MDNEMYKLLANAIKDLADRQDVIAFHGVIIGTILSGLNITSTKDLRERLDEFKEKYDELIINFVGNDNQVKTFEDVTEAQLLIMEASQIVFTKVPKAHVEINIDDEANDD